MLLILSNKLQDTTNQAIQVALERFSWTLTDDLEIDRRFLFVVMGLEPLFLPELSVLKKKKLSIRISQLFKELGYDLNIIQKEIKDAFKIRSYITHGSKLSEKLEKRMNELYPKILNYLRISLIIYLLHIDLGRNDFVKLIDKSILDGNFQELQKIIKNDKKRFKVCFLKF